MNGLAEKQFGLDLVESHNSYFVQAMREEAERVCRTEGSVTIDDLRPIAARRGLEPGHQNAWGAIFKGRRWHKLGYTQSTHPTNHGRAIAIWELRA